LIETGQFIPLGLFIFIFSQAFLISLRFSKAFSTVESQRKRLRKTNQVIKKGIRKRVKAEKALKESHERFLTVLDSIDADIYVADMSTYRILFMNQHMKDTVGHDFTGQICWQVFGKGSKPCSHCNNEKLLNPEGKPIGVIKWEYEDPITGKWYLNYDRAIKWDNNRYVQLQIATDATDQKQVQKTLQQAKDELETTVSMRTADLLKANEALSLEIEERKQAQENAINARRAAEIANRAKSEFLANMSHELRTPLNHILGFTELVVDKSVGELNEIQEEYLNDVLQSSNHLLALINDILDLSKVESGKMELDISEFVLKDFLNHSLGIVKEKAMKRGLKISMDLKTLPDTLKADKRKLKQVLYNLLSNAVKFTPDGGSILLAVKQINGSEMESLCESGVVSSVDHTIKSDFIKISVSDSGIGLAKDNLDRIFDPFEQADNSASRKFQGTGLGLSLTRQLVEFHNGCIWAESKGEGKGSTFSFVIPV
jgi:signal transduction histidine kinase